jgi:phage terminase small subunit
MGRATRGAKEAGLTDRQERFCREYLANAMNGEMAAIAAGYSVKRARSQASTLLANRNISQRIDELSAPIVASLEMTAEEIAQETSRIARSRITQVVKFGPGGVTPLDSDTLSDDAIATVAEVSQTISAEGGSIRVKQHDKLGALKLMAQYRGMLHDKVEVTMPWAKELAAMTADELRARADALRAARDKE